MNMMRLSKFRTEKASGSFPREFYQRNKFLCRRRLFCSLISAFAYLKNWREKKVPPIFPEHNRSFVLVVVDEVEFVMMNKFSSLNTISFHL